MIVYHLLTCVFTQEMLLLQADTATASGQYISAIQQIFD